MLFKCYGIMLILALSISGCSTSQIPGNQVMPVGFSSSRAPSQVVVAESNPPQDTPDHGWKQYRNDDYGFTFEYPEGSTVSNKDIFSYNISVELPRTPKTKIESKSMSVTIRRSVTAQECFGLITWKGTTQINGIEYHYIPGFKWDHAMGGLSFFASDYYSMHGDDCMMIEARLGVRDPTGFVDDPAMIPPDPPYEDLDTSVFDRMLSTFRFTK